MHDRFGPFKRMSFGIMGLNEAINRLAQLLDRSEAGAPQGLAAQDAEPALHLVEPTGSGWSVVKMHVRMTRQPTVPFWFVRVPGELLIRDTTPGQFQVLLE